MFDFENNNYEDIPVLVLGSASIDIVGHLSQSLEKGTSSPANIRTSFGGTARNFAENLARLGQPVTLLTAIGSDAIGQQLMEYTASAGVNMEHTIILDDTTTGAYLAVIDEKGELSFALDDMQPIKVLDKEYLLKHKALFADAALLFIDANLTDETLNTALQLAQEYNLPVAGDPTSASLTNKLLPYLKQINLMTPNSTEAGIICEKSFDSRDASAALDAAKILVHKGVDISIVTLAEFGVSYATSETQGHIPAIRTRTIDPTGAGDALNAAVVFALLNEIGVDEAVRLGVAAASLTLRHRGAVFPDLSLELLYDQL